jgi:transcriptional regulator with XRE-family HTH domain
VRINGEALKALREKDGRTVSELAATAGIDRSHLSNIEAGRRGVHPKMVGELARILGVPFSALTNGVKQEDVA